MNIEAESTLDLPTLIEGRRWFWKTRFRLRIIRWLYPVLGIFFGIILALYLWVGRGDSSIAPGFLALLFLLSPALKNWQFKRMVKKMPNFGKEIHWNFTDTHIQLVFGDSTSSI